MSAAIDAVQVLPWQADLWVQLARQISRDRLPNGLLLVGPAGVGKRALTERVLASLLCSSRTDDAAPCGQCKGCTLRAAGHHPDLVIAQAEEGKATLAVDVVREFNRKMFLTSSHGSGRIGWLPAADTMNTAAANALLKTLEEPPAGATMILVASSLAALPATIRSRCQLVPVAIAKPQLAIDWLRERYPALDQAAIDWYAARPMLADHAEAEQGARKSWKQGLQAVWAGQRDPLDCAAQIDDNDIEPWTAYGHHLLCDLLRGDNAGEWPQARADNRSAREALRRLADSVQAALHLGRSQANKRLMIEMQCMEWSRAGRVVRQQGAT